MRLPSSETIFIGIMILIIGLIVAAVIIDAKDRDEKYEECVARTHDEDKCYFIYKVDHSTTMPIYING